MITANTYTNTRLPHQADALRLLDDQLDQPEPKARRHGAPNSASAAETRGEPEPPTTSNDHDS
jgi:hypothetical protein